MKKLFGANLLIGALVLLLLATPHAVAISDADKAQNSGVVAPDNIYDHQSFTFAATQVAEGEVVSIQTADGVVVQRSSADKLGRVFLAAGLPAGAYLISLAGGDSGHAREAGRIEVHQRPSSALERPWEHAPPKMQLTGSPRFAKISDSSSLTGYGFSPKAAEMQASVSASGQTQAVPILAATEDQLKLAPVAQLSPGPAKLTVTNMATGQSVESGPVLFYDMQGHLERRTLKSGRDQTQLVVSTKPENLPLKVKVNVVSGPVDFGGGDKETEAVTNDGQAVFPVYAERGAGHFQLAWALALSDPCRDDSSPALQDKQEWQKRAAKEEQDADKDEKGGRRKSAAEHRERAAEDRRKAGQPDKAAENEEKGAKDYRDEADGQDREADKKKSLDKAADAEQRAAKDHESEAAEKLKCKDNKGAADELKKARDDYKRAAGDYKETHEASKQKEMERKADEEDGKADKLDK